MGEEFGFEKDFAEIGKDGGAVGVDAAVSECTLDIFEGEEDFGFGEIFAAEIFEVASQFVAAGSASPAGSVGETEAVMIGMRGEGAAASIGEGETAEGRAGKFNAFAGHRESMKKK